MLSKNSRSFYFQSLFFCSKRIQYYKWTIYSRIGHFVIYRMTLYSGNSEETFTEQGPMGLGAQAIFFIDSPSGMIYKLAPLKIGYKVTSIY